MIYDTLKNADNYRGISANLDRALDALKNTDFSALEAGTYEVDGKNIYYMVQEPVLHQGKEAQFEAHRRYIDIQYALTDGEWIGWRAVEQVPCWKPFDEAKDVMLSDVDDDGVLYPLNAGEFVIFFPSDAHKPCLYDVAPLQTRKVVFKIRI